MTTRLSEIEEKWAGSVSRDKNGVTQPSDMAYLLALVRSLEAEVTCLRSVLSEWDTDKSCYTQMIQADQIAKEREGL